MTVDWAGRKFGELTPDEQRQATAEAARGLERELQTNSERLAQALEDDDE